MSRVLSFVRDCVIFCFVHERHILLFNHFKCTVLLHDPLFHIPFQKIPRKIVFIFKMEILRSKIHRTSSLFPFTYYFQKIHRTSSLFPLTYYLLKSSECKF